MAKITATKLNNLINPIRWIDNMTRSKDGLSRFWLWRFRKINQFKTKYLGWDPFKDE